MKELQTNNTRGFGPFFMKGNIHISDHLEQKLADFFTEHHIEFIHESQNKDQVLDFYLPAFGIYIEVKQYHTERVGRQLAHQDEVILIQGKKALAFFIDNFKI